MRIQLSSISFAFALIPSDLPTVRGGLTASILRFNSTSEDFSGIQFQTGEKELRLGIGSPPGSLCFSDGNIPMLTFDAQSSSVRIDSNEFVITNFFKIDGEVMAAGVKQWRLAMAEDFSLGALGWDDKRTDLVTECAGIKILGGFGKFGKGEITKTYDQIPPHTQLRIKANFHFIDGWVGETGFLRLNIGKEGGMVHVWTDTHSQETEGKGISLCGGEVPEGKFSVPIEVIVPHELPSVVVGFGTTIETDDPTDQSWGISGMEIYIR